MCEACNFAGENNQTSQAMYPNCPYYRRNYQIFNTVHVKHEPWNGRGDVNFPAVEEDQARTAANLIGNQAPCCRTGYKNGDYVVRSTCHFMHAWCFMVERTRIDGCCLFNLNVKVRLLSYYVTPVLALSIEPVQVLGLDLIMVLSYFVAPVLALSIEPRQVLGLDVIMVRYLY
ncbi:hypothetical protein C2S52_012576 [Perilla frutescens var. hirtella]|nr:hypothetical protein C2S52_012576 [Perilla frutescens var. hirtella]